MAVKTTCLISLLLLSWSCSAVAGQELKTLKSKDSYQIQVGLEGSKGQLAGKLVLEIQVKGKWKFNKKAPVVLNIEGAEQVVLANRKLRKKDVVKLETKRCRFEVAYRTEAKGSYPLQLKFDFVICTDTLCQKKRFTQEYSLPVQ